jgi:hypothetical protein
MRQKLRDRHYFAERIASSAAASAFKCWHNIFVLEELSFINKK